MAYRSFICVYQLTFKRSSSCIFSKYPIWIESTKYIQVEGITSSLWMTRLNNYNDKKRKESVLIKKYCILMSWESYSKGKHNFTLCYILCNIHPDLNLHHLRINRHQPVDYILAHSKFTISTKAQQRCRLTQIFNFHLSDTRSTLSSKASFSRWRWTPRSAASQMLSG